MGVARLRPVLTRRTTPERVNVERMRANAIEAAEQCGILRIPEVHAPEKLETVVAGWDAARPLVFCDEGSEERCPFTTLARLQPGPLALLIGPEGGFDESERAAARIQAIRGAHLTGAAHPARRYGRGRRSRPCERGARRLALDRSARAWLVRTGGFQLTRGAAASPSRNTSSASENDWPNVHPTGQRTCPHRALARGPRSPGSRRARKPAHAWRIGTEHEKFLFYTDTLRPVPYAGPRGVRALMEGLIARFGWEPILEGDNIIALKRPEGEAGGTVSLEPGGQFELSGAPLKTVHEIGAETHEHLDAGARRRRGLCASASSASASRPTGRSTRRRACPSSATR